MSALARAYEALGVARRELEAAASEVRSYDVATTRFLRAEVVAIRDRVDRVRRAVGELTPEPPAAA